jgi:hypothetical protein
MSFEDGFLRSLRLGRYEVLRGIYVAVRDRNWGTVPGRFSDLRLQIAKDSFTIRFRAEHRQGDIHFAWGGVIRGRPDGQIRFEMDGEARSTFLRNRIGFCVLHPIRECAGKPCRMQTTEGSVVETSFPQFISPHQPFKNLQAMIHEIEPGLRAEVRFEGEVFETEDQRNWTDASFKTYCTPLELPFPVEISPGTRIRQSVQLRLLGGPAAASFRPIRRQAGVTLTLDARKGLFRLPDLGLGMASHRAQLDGQEMARLKALHLTHLRQDLDMSEAGWEVRLERAAAEAEAAGVGLELALILRDPEGDLTSVLAALKRIGPPVSRWLVFRHGEPSTSRETADAARRCLKRYAPQVPLAGGTNAFFAELNRNRPPIDALDQICYSINPQVHAFDDATLVQNLEAQSGTVASARRFCGDLPIIISPVTLRMRFNPNATGLQPDTLAGELPPEVDSRQMSLFGLVWTVGSLKYLAEGGAASITYYETTGWRGVMEREQGSSMPQRFGSLPGAVFPLYFALRDVADLRGGTVVPLRSSDPLLVDGLAIDQAGSLRVLLANMTAERQRVCLEGLGSPARLCLLDARNALQAVRHPERYPGTVEKVAPKGGVLDLVLLPHAYARIDFQRI